MQPEEKLDRTGRPTGLPRYTTVDIDRRPSMYVDDPGNHFLSRFDPIRDLLSGSLNRLSKTTRGHVVACIGEFIGTILFFFLAFAAAEVATISTRNNAGDAADSRPTQLGTDQLLYMSLAFGFSLAVTAWTFFRISGGLFNPAVTVGMYLIGAINLLRCVLLFILQCIGAIVASYIVQALFAGGLNVGTSLKRGTSNGQGVVIEMLLTAQLTFTIFMLAAEKQEATYVAPVGIGLSIFIGELVGILWTGGSMNPARSLGPAVATHSFPSYHWIYWVGPLTGAVLAVLMYKLMKAFEYETVNVTDPEAVPVTHDSSQINDAQQTSNKTPLEDIELKPLYATRPTTTDSLIVNTQPSIYPKDQHPNPQSHRTSIAAPGHLSRRETEADLSEHDDDSPKKARSRSTTYSRLMQSRLDKKGRVELPPNAERRRANSHGSFGMVGLRTASEDAGHEERERGL